MKNRDLTMVVVWPQKLLKQAIMLLSFALLSLPMSSYAQVTAASEKFDASISESMLIVIDTDAALKDSYKADISKLSFASEEQARKAFGTVSSNLVGYALDWESQSVTIELRNDRLKSDWSVEDWNKYFQKRSKR